MAQITPDSSDAIFQRALCKLLVEIFDGPPGREAYLLNPGDPGLLRQLESVDARAASTRTMPGKTTIASHVDHVHYGFTLMNRWASGESVCRRRLGGQLEAHYRYRRPVANASRQSSSRVRSVAKTCGRPHLMGRHGRRWRAFQRRAHGLSSGGDTANSRGDGT
jgi:hypothetical protein